MKSLALLLSLILLVGSLSAREFHVSVDGSDAHDGAVSRPFKTISAAARIAQPGDVITVHKGTYRERINPPRGGDSDSKRIVYQAARGETVRIKGSEIVAGWKRVQGGVWKTTLPASFFGDYNPYQNLIHGDWFDDKGRPHHTGEVFINGASLFETASIEGVMNPKPYQDALDKEASTYTWYCENDDSTTTIWANFHDYNPNKELVEINVRQSCFYPDAPGRSYITVRGFHLSQAATQWAPPTAEQIGLVGTHWSKGWIIEDNVISNSKCSGITLGKDRRTGQNVWSKDKSKGGDIHYNKVIVRALKAGWSKENIGSHIVRNNTIFDCEQTGMCGSLGAAFSRISNNHIYNIWTKRQFQGAEIAGIKIHAAIDVLIKNNRLHNVGRGMWMDWMAQGTRISANLCYDNTTDDLFCEVDHGPYLVDNNIFLSETAIQSWSEGGAYVHNLAAGFIISRPSRRPTPYHKAHSTEVAGLKNIVNGDDRFYNNIFVAGEAEIPARSNPKDRRKIGYGLDVYNRTELPMYVDGNIYLNGAKPFGDEKNYIEKADFDPKIEIVEKGKNVFLRITFDSSIKDLNTTLITTKRLGTAVIPGLPYENPDGTPLHIDRNYFGGKRNEKKPTAGPFEKPGVGEKLIKVW